MELDHHLNRGINRAVTLEQRIKEICETRVRFGYRRVHGLPRRKGWEINAKKTYLVYKELGMQLRNKTPKRRVMAKLLEDRKESVNPNDVWAMDFVHDQLATGRKIRIQPVCVIKGWKNEPQAGTLPVAQQQPAGSRYE